MTRAALALALLLVAGCGAHKPPSPAASVPGTPYLVTGPGADVEAVQVAHQFWRTRNPGAPVRSATVYVHADYWDMRDAFFRVHQVGAVRAREEFRYGLWIEARAHRVLHVYAGYKGVPYGLLHGVWHVQEPGLYQRHVGDWVAREREWLAALVPLWQSRP